MSGNYEGLRHVRPVRPATEPAQNTSFQIDKTTLREDISRAVGPQLGEWSLRFPETQGQPVILFYVLTAPEHPGALNELIVDPQTGEVMTHKRYTDQPVIDRLLISNFTLHVGSYFGIAGRIAVLMASACMPLFFVTGWLLYLARRPVPAKTV